MVVRNKYATLLVRSLMMLTWVVLIFLFLYLFDLWTSRSETKSINVFCWSGMFDIKYIAEFEKRSGIKVKFSYFESNDELLVKLRATKGYGYDLIIPGDYAVHVLVKENFLTPLDKTKIGNFKNINPLLLAHYFDPDNRYSIPAEWGVFGLGIDKDLFSKPPEPTWGLVFDPGLITSKIVMANDPLVAIPLAAFYLFGSIENLTVDKLEKIKELLLRQRPFVEAYTEFRPDYYLATKNCAVAVSSSSYMWRSMRQYGNLDFIIPKEGSLITIENYAIPRTSQKEDLVYEFINFMLEPETVAHHFEELALFPVTVDVLQFIKLTGPIRHLLTLSPAEFKKFSFLRLDQFKEPVNEQYLQDLWVMVKS